MTPVVILAVAACAWGAGAVILMRWHPAATLAGLVLSIGLVDGWCRYFWLPPISWPESSPAHPVASYLAWATGPFGNYVTLAVLVWFIFFACFLVAGLAAARQARRDAPHLEETNPGYAQQGAAEYGPWTDTATEVTR